MTVIISRNKKHVHLGRMMVTTTAKIQLLSDISKRTEALLFKISQLDELYSEWEGNEFPPDMIDKLAEEKQSVRKVASAYAMIGEVVNRELRKSIKDLDTYETELEKAEKTYQKVVKKAEKKLEKKVVAEEETAPVIPVDQKMIDAVSDALIQAENKKA